MQHARQVKLCSFYICCFIAQEIVSHTGGQLTQQPKKKKNKLFLNRDKIHCNNMQETIPFELSLFDLLVHLLVILS